MMHGKRPAHKNQPLTWENVLQALRSRTAHCVYILLCCTAVLCVLFFLAITPQRYDLKVGDISPATITKMGKNGHVTTEVLLKICTALDCQMDEILEVIPDK